MPARYCSLSQQGHLQPHSKSRAWQLSTLLLNALQYYGLEKVLLLGMIMLESLATLHINIDTSQKSFLKITKNNLDNLV